MNRQDNLNLVHLLYSGQGGLGTYFINFVKSDINKRFQHVAVFYGVEELYWEYEDFCKLHEIPFYYFQKTKAIDFKNWKQIVAVIESYTNAVVFAHTFSITPALVWLLSKKQKVFAVDHTSSEFKTKLEWLYTLYHINFSEFIVFYESQTEVLKRKYYKLVPQNKGHMIPKNVDINFFVPDKSVKNNAEGLIVGMASRVINGKRMDLLVELAKRYKESGTKGVKISIAGAGPNLEKFKSIVKKEQLEDHVEFIGLLSRVQLLRFYQQLDIYVHASEGETICYSIMEAQSCGLPVLASNVKGINNYISDGIDGILFNNSIDELDKKLRALIKDSSLLNSLSLQSRCIAEDNYMKYNNAEMLYKIIAK